MGSTGNVRASLLQDMQAGLGHNGKTPLIEASRHLCPYLQLPPTQRGLGVP
jgi:hypothetical protein